MIARVLFATACVAACTSASSSPTAAVPPTAAARPPSSVSTSSGSSTGGVDPADAPRGCPSSRDNPQAVANPTEALLRERLPGMYRSCTSKAGLEIRIDPATDRVAWWFLDDRFVRTGDDGFVELSECGAASCSAVWHSAGDQGLTGPQPTNSALYLYAEPTAVELDDTAALDGSLEWVRVAD